MPYKFLYFAISRVLITRIERLMRVNLTLWSSSESKVVLISFVLWECCLAILVKLLFKFWLIAITLLMPRYSWEWGLSLNYIIFNLVFSNRLTRLLKLIRILLLITISHTSCHLQLIFHILITNELLNQENI